LDNNNASTNCKDSYILPNLNKETVELTKEITTNPRHAINATNQSTNLLNRASILQSRRTTTNEPHQYQHRQKVRNQKPMDNSYQITKPVKSGAKPQQLRSNTPINDITPLTIIANKDQLQQDHQQSRIINSQRSQNHHQQYEIISETSETMEIKTISNGANTSKQETISIVDLVNQSATISQQDPNNTNNTTGAATFIQQIIPQYDTTPVRRNEAWGASINNLPPTIFCIYFQNINGIQYKTPNSRWQPHLNYMKDKGISISGLAETNTNWQHKEQLMIESNSVFKNSSVIVADNEFNPPDRSPYLPGGCLQICTDHWTARIIETYHDPRRMGRWIGQKYRMRDGKKLSIITAYRPCLQSSKENTKASITATHQQKLLYRRYKKKDIDPRKLFMSDITELITNIEKIQRIYVY
jgi:hypothetical protein